MILILGAVLMLPQACKSKQKKKEVPAKVIDLVPDIVNKEKVNPVTADSTINYNAYEDIDMFKLKGINKLKSPVPYPFIEIYDSANTKNVVYWKSPTDSVHDRYYKKGNMWVTNWEGQADTGYIRTYSYIMPDKLIEVDYGAPRDRRNYNLSAIIEYEPHAETWYAIEKIDRNYFYPHKDSIEKYKKLAVRTGTSKYVFKDGKMIESSTQYEKRTNATRIMDDHCYLTDNHSRFWFRHFGDYQKKCD